MEQQATREYKRSKFCNMTNVERWSEGRICPTCSNRKELEFEKGFRPRSD